MDTNVHHESTEYTEETECLADVGYSSNDIIGNKLMLNKKESEQPPSARRFVTLRASANNIMRKFEVHNPLDSDGFRLFYGLNTLRATKRINDNKYHEKTFLIVCRGVCHPCV